MLEDIKQILLDNPDKIVELLEFYEFAHIRPKPTEIRFARNEEGGQNISIKLHDNPSLYVKDFVNNDGKDLIGFIMDQRNLEFIDVLNQIKSILGLADDWKPRQSCGCFGGFYDSLDRNKTQDTEEYPESILDQYQFVGNKRWVRDGIPISTQKKYNVHYDTNENLIIFPWRSALSGRILAVKARVNYIPDDDQPKYFYVHKGSVSNSLYGYSENYSNLINCDKLFVFEAEKSVMICDAWGIQTAVALGSHALSDCQAKLIMSLNPKEVCFMLDKDLSLEETYKNIDKLKEYAIMKETKISYWDWTNNQSVCEKGAPVDMGHAVWSEIIKTEIQYKE